MNIEYFAAKPQYRENRILTRKPQPKSGDDSFHESIKPVAKCVQFLALMPVCGISSVDHADLKFRWTSKRTIYTLIYIAYGFVVSTFFFLNIYAAGISAKNIGRFCIAQKYLD